MQGAMKVMPLLFGFFSWNFPTGLVLYFAVSNLFRVGQQSVIMKLGDTSKEAGAKKKAGSKNPGPSPEEKPEKRRTGQSPHTRKKRKKRRRK